MNQSDGCISESHLLSCIFLVPICLFLTLIQHHRQNRRSSRNLRDTITTCMSYLRFYCNFPNIKKRHFFLNPVPCFSLIHALFFVRGSYALASSRNIFKFRCVYLVSKLEPIAFIKDFTNVGSSFFALKWFVSLFRGETAVIH